MSRLIVKPHSPKRQRLTLLGLALVLGVASWGLYEYGRASAGLDFTSLGERVGEQLTRIDELEKENSRLRAQVAVQERSREIEREAYKRLDETVTSLQDENLELQQELAFFRGIISPLDGKSGLTLQEFALTPVDGTQRWHYRLVLTQVLKNDTVISGKVRILVHGESSDGSRSLNLSELGAGDDALRFRFKYFQTLEGDIELPEGFLPASLEVKVDPYGKVYKELVRSIDWPAEES